MAERKVGVLNIINPPNKQNDANLNLEDDVIKYYLMPSLQHISTSNVIITLWSREDIKYEIKKIFNDFEKYAFFGADTYQLFQAIKDKVLDKLSYLGVPDRIRKMLSYAVHPIGQEIFEWIEYQDKYIFNNGDYLFQNLKPVAVNYIDNIIWTPRGVIDYKETAKTLLATEKLFDTYKYIIACAFCLEDHIKIIAPKVIETTLSLKLIERHSMVYFWTAHITGNFSELDRAVHCYNIQHNTNYTRNECLFTVLIDNGRNQTAIKYIWDKLSYEEKSRKLVPAIKKTSNTDIRCFLLSQISKEQEKVVFKNYDACKILLRFLDDWLWGDYFLPTINHIWDVISGNDYLVVIENIVIIMERNDNSIEQNNRFRATFKEVWQCAPKHLKEFIFQHDNGYRGQNLFFNLFNEKTIDIFQLMLADINDEKKTQIMFSFSGIDNCSTFIKGNRWDLLEMLIGHTLFSKEDVESFKEALIKEKGQEIAAAFIINKVWNKMENFLQWAFKSDDDIRTFKQKLTHSEICNDMLEFLVAKNKADFTEIEHFLEWGFSGDEGRIVKRKSEIPQSYFRKFICKLIEDNKYELLDEILNWCFVYDEKQISHFKQHFYYAHKSFLIVELVVILIKQDDQLQSFEKFLHWCFMNDEEINKFKTCILHPAQVTVGVCVQLLCGEMFKLADEFVSWCCNSSQIQIDKFKNQLMIDDDMEYFCGFDDVWQKYNERQIIEWFNPSKETAVKFKERFKKYSWFKDFLSELDNYVKEKRDKAIIKDVDNISQSALLDITNQDNENMLDNNLTASPTEIISEKINTIM